MKKFRTCYKELNSPGRNDSQVCLSNKIFFNCIYEIESKREMKKIPHHNDTFYYTSLSP